MSSPANPPPVLDIQNLGIQRGPLWILQNVDWTLHRGQHWILLGPNGSGKTSLLSALTGYTTPTTGDIHLLGSTFGQADWRELRKKIGLVSSSIRELMAPTETALETIVTGKYAMIDYWGKIKKADRQQGLAILQQINALHLQDRPWGYLSQGERQRILIGRALMADPALLILDEPCAGLDPIAREHFLQFINQLGCTPTAPTLILVTHHVEEIMPAFTHLLLLKAGQVVAAGERSRYLTQKWLITTFGHPLRLITHTPKNRYQIQVPTTDKCL